MRKLLLKNPDSERLVRVNKSHPMRYKYWIPPDPKDSVSLTPEGGLVKSKLETAMPSSFSLIASLIKLLLLIYVGLDTYLYIMQRHFIYFSTAESNDPHAQVLSLHSDNEQLKVWVLNLNNAS